MSRTGKMITDVEVAAGRADELLRLCALGTWNGRAGVERITDMLMAAPEEEYGESYCIPLRGIVWALWEELVGEEQ